MKMATFSWNSSDQVLIFYILLITMIPSLLAFIYVLIQFTRVYSLRSRINNHLILLLLAINFIQVLFKEIFIQKKKRIFIIQIATELPLNLFLLITGKVLIQTYSFCIFWNIYNFSLVGIGLFALAYGCIERYLLIYHRVFFNKHLLLLHYIPFSLCVIYPTVFYIYVVAIYPCVNSFSYEHALCGRPCYEYEVSSMG